MVILRNIEEIIISVINLDYSFRTEKLMLNINEVFERTISLFNKILEIESIAYMELFGQFFHKLLKILQNSFKFSSKLKNYMSNFFYLFNKILYSITEKKIECVDKYFDCKVILKLSKVRFKEL